MLAPPMRVFVQGQPINEASNTLNDMEESSSFKAPEGGLYTPVSSVQIVMPMPHPTEHQTNQLINPLAYDTQAPSTHTSGVRMTAFDLRFPADYSPRRKPRTSLIHNKSSYLSRTQVFHRFNRFIDKTRGGHSAALITVGRSAVLLHAALSSHFPQDPLIRISFTKAWPLVHAVNLSTLSRSSVDIVFGMSSGDILWVELTTARYTRINKAGNLTHAAVTSIAWIPNSDSRVIAGHADGSLVIYDIEREDGISLEKGSDSELGTNHILHVYTCDSTPVATSNSTAPANPVRAFKVSNQPITDIQFSADPNVIALASQDGFLRFLDLDLEIVPDVFPSFFGGLFTIAFSPDGRYFACGGEDDAISVIDSSSRRLVARLEGHYAFVRKVVFDKYTCQVDQQFYRLFSVAEDSRLLLWDFCPEALPPSKSEKARPLARTISRTQVQPVISRHSVPRISPVAVGQPSQAAVAKMPLCDIFYTDEIITCSSSDGRTWTWKRPEHVAQNGSEPSGLDFTKAAL